MSILKDCSISVIDPIYPSQYTSRSQQSWSLILILPLVFSCSSPFSKPFGTVSNVPSTICNTVTYICVCVCVKIKESEKTDKYLNRQWSSIYLFTFFYFYSTVDQKGNIHQTVRSLFVSLIHTKYDPLAMISWSVWFSKYEIILCASFSTIDSGLCIYHLELWLKFNLTHNSQRITFPTLVFCCVFSLFTLT